MTRYIAGQPDGMPVRMDPDGFAALAPAREESAVPVWIDFEGVMDPAVAERLTDAWNLHALAVHMASDPAAGSVRLQEHASHLSLGLTAVPEGGADPDGQRRIGVVMGRDYLLTFHAGREPVVESMAERLATGIPSKAGAAYLLYELLDMLLEGYFESTESISEAIDSLDARLTDRNDAKSLARMQEEILTIKKRLLALHRALIPLRDSLQSMRQTDGGLIRDSDRAYLRHASDQVLSILDTVSGDRDVLAGASEILMSAGTKRMNEVMTFLTVFTTFFIPINFIASVYGMNLLMPEFGYRWSYPIVLGVMAVIVAGMFLWFRRRGWL